ncbi:response regulator [uncultured Draconibacterium sp.]|uniref:response regulator n=1 Tax=uncultured Draconibacterium sp. TaxID=1573823 RepID=UPI0029C8FAF2|nr:response regulator [uncultured Draconibacterium sp.]
MNKVSFIFVVSLFLVSHVYAQNLKRFKQLNLSNGLSHTDATCFVQDEVGYMWIGTYNGLNRYDGTEVKQFINEPNDRERVYVNRINVLKTQDNYLWVGTQKGIHLFNTEYLTFCELNITGVDKEYSNIGNIKSIYTSESTVWFSSDNKLFRGIFNKEEQTLEVVSINNIVSNYPKEFDDVIVGEIIGVKDNIIWLSTNMGLFELEKDENVYQLKKAPAPITKFSSEIAHGLTRQGNMLFFSHGHLLHLYLLQSNFSVGSLIKTIDVRTLLTNEFKNSTIDLFSLCVDNEMNLWCSTTKGVLFLTNLLSKIPSAELFRNSKYDSHSISGNHISSLYIDRNNCLWVGTWGSGANILNLGQYKFNVLCQNPDRQKYNLSKDFVRCITEDKYGKIWIGYKGGGLDIFNPQTGVVTPFLPENEEGRETLFNDIRCIDVGSNFIVVGCTNGLALIDLKTSEVYEYFNRPQDSCSISSGPVFSVQVDDRNNIWAAMWETGLNRITVDVDYHINVKKFNVTDTPRLASNSINFLAFNEAGNQLYASSNKGLNRIYLDDNRNIERIVHYKANDSDSSLRSEYVWPLVIENDSTLWAGTLGGGLHHLNLENKVAGVIGTYTAQNFTFDVMNTMDVEILEKDNKGNIWAGSRGLVRLNPETKTIQYYNEDDGLHGNGFKIGASFLSRNGTIYMGGINGITYFNPADIIHSEITSNVKLIKLKVNNKEVVVGDRVNGRRILDRELALTDRIVLNHNENDFSIQYGNLHFLSQGKGLIRHRLLPIQDKWQMDNDFSMIANYANLSYGSYIFQAIGDDVDEIENSQIAELEIVINAPWYLTHFAIIAYVLLGSLIFTAILLYSRRLMYMKHNLRVMAAEEQKREELHQHKLQFFTNISHEFKTPLTLIHSPLEKLYAHEKPEGERKELYQLVFNNTKRLSRLINELMDFRKAELNKHSLKLQLTDLNLLVDEVYKQFCSLADNKHICLSYTPQSCPKILVDRNKSQKVITNLFSNALKFTSENGKIDIKTYSGKIEVLNFKFRNRHSEVADSQNTEYVFVEIEDTGVGISSKSITVIFERYFHEDLDSNNHLGSGIGLALVKSFVLLQQGCVFVSSERNKGTQFIVGFPCGDEHVLKTNAIVVDNESVLKSKEEFNWINGEGEAKENAVLLIVEDNSELRTMLVKHFQTQFIVFGAENGKVGLQMAKEKMPDLIISDVMMPEMDGIEMCRLVRNDINTSHIPILLLTAKSSVPNQIAGAENGADAFMAKPFSLRLLEANVARMLEHQRVLKERYTKDIFSNTREIIRNNKDKEFFDKLMTVIEENIENPEFTVEDLVPQLGISRTKLYQKIKGVTGCSPLEFIRSQRLKLAAKILLTEGVTISEVVYRVGIQSTSYFSKAFKSEFGMTPSDFLKNYDNTGKNA